MNKEKEAIVTARTIEGAPLRAIGEEIGMSHVSVLRTLNKPDIRAMIEAAGQRIIQEALEDAIDNRVQVVRALRNRINDPTASAPGILSELTPTELVTIGLKESQGVRQTAGVDPSQSTSMVVNMVYNDNRTTELPPEIRRLMGQQDVIEGEYEEIG